jgi:hypothetical protein
MIGNLARRSEQTENKAMEQTDARCRRTSRSLAFADHMDRFVAGERAPSEHARIWCHRISPRSRAVRNLAANPLRHRRPGRWRLGIDEAGRSGNCTRRSLARVDSELP